MAKIFPIDTIKGMSGKVCSHSSTYFSMNKVTGETHTGVICAPYEGPASQLQIAHRSKFAKKAQQVNAWLTSNKGSDAYKTAQALRKQLKLASVRSVIYHYIDDEGIVTLPDTITTGGGSAQQPATPPSGGNDAGGGF